MHVTLILSCILSQPELDQSTIKKKPYILEASSGVMFHSATQTKQWWSNPESNKKNKLAKQLAPRAQYPPVPKSAPEF